VTDTSFASADGSQNPEPGWCTDGPKNPADFFLRGKVFCIHNMNILYIIFVFVNMTFFTILDYFCLGYYRIWFFLYVGLK
jgi:hypothetical protein